MKLKSVAWHHTEFQIIDLNFSFEKQKRERVESSEGFTD